MLSPSSLCASWAGRCFLKMHILAWGWGGCSRKSFPSQKLKRACPSLSGGWGSVHRPAAQSLRLCPLVLDAGAQSAGVAPFWGGPASWCARDPLSLCPQPSGL